MLWIDPYPVRLPRASDFRRPAVLANENDAPPAWMRTLRSAALPLEPLAAGRWFNRRLLWPRALDAVAAFSAQGETLIGIGKPSDLALAALERFADLPSLYDAMDDFSAFHSGLSRAFAAKAEQDIMRRVNWRATSSTNLASRMRQAGMQAERVGNGLAADRLPVATAPAPSGPFGYVGTVAAWFDWDWVIDLASAWPDRRVEIHGPVFMPPSKALPPNVVLGPAMPHGEALLKMQTFSAGLIPFLRNDLTDAVDPVKFYEYRGLGLPVLSTPFGEMRHRGDEPGVLLTDKPSAAREAIARLASHRDTAESVAAFRREHDWSARFAPLSALIGSR